MKIIMRSFHLLHGLKRSGNHAVVNWLMAHNRFVFFNNIIPIARILKRERPMPEPVAFDHWLSAASPVPFWNTIRTRKKRILLGLEDHSLRVKPFTDLPDSARNILILRDPFNLFASRIRKAPLVDNPAYARQPGEGFNRAISLWKEHAREFLGDTSHFSNKTVIYFNKWFVSEAYRRKTCECLELEFSDKGLSTVSDHGGGSSFDGSKYNSRARDMDVLNRVGSLSASERVMFDIVANDPEIQQLHDRIEERVNG